MNVRHASLAVLLVAALAGCAGTAGFRHVTDADAPRALPGDGPVSVGWEDPGRFSEIRLSLNPREAARGQWVQELAAHLRDAAAKTLPAGQRMDITILDIERAGEFEPVFGFAHSDVRVMRDPYPPRMRLHVRRLDAAGGVLEDAEHKLMDLGYLTLSTPVHATDPLRYEKRMIDRWVQRHLASR